MDETFPIINSVAMNKLVHESLCMFSNVCEDTLLDMELLGQPMAGITGAWPRSLLWDWYRHSLATADIGC